jgi:TolB-like protein
VTEPSKAVFLSYASQDSEATSRICEALRAAGIEVWFDRSELRGGDAWDQKIRREIRDCALFIPLISANTAARAEGYFRLEWSIAEQRSHMIARNKAFIVPVCIDATPESGADVPESFQRVQWTRLPGGDTPPAFAARIAALLGAPVAASASTTAPITPSGEVRAAAAKPTSRIRLAAIALAILVVVGLAYVVFEWFQLSKQTPADRRVAAVAPAPAVPAVPEKSVAVLPFVDMSEKKDQEYFSDGLSEELIDRLTKVHDLRVPARTSSFYFKEKSTPIPEIARALKVAYVLEGSVRRVGNRIRITAQLIRADTGYHVWSMTYDRPFKELFGTQSEIAEAISKTLRATIGVHADVGGLSTASPEAFDLYLQAAALEAESDETDKKAIALLERAVALDPNYSDAWVALSGRCIDLWTLPNADKAALATQARDAAQRAIDTDSTNARAYDALALVHDHLDFDSRAERAARKRAAELDPNGKIGLRNAYWYHQERLELTEALAAAQKSVEADPLSDYSWAILSNAYDEAGKPKDAEDAIRRAIDLNSGNESLYFELADIRLHAGNAIGALDAIREVKSESEYSGVLSLIYEALGRPAEAQAALRAYVARVGETRSARVHVLLYARRGDIDHSIQWLERAYAGRVDAEIFTVFSEPDLKPFLNDPRILGLRRKFGLID